LWYICAEILNREIARFARQAGIKLRHLVAREAFAGGDNVVSNATGLRRESVSAQAKRDQAVVVGPNRAVLVRQRIEGRMLGR
jgi:hypothetical protein